MIGQQLFLDAGRTYSSSYLWSTGDTTQVIAVLAADTFNVFVPIGQGGFISSAYIVVTDPASFCNASAIENSNSENDFAIYPNPVTNELRIDLAANSQEQVVRIFDSTGRCIFSKQKNSSDHKLIIPLQHLPVGAYYLLINGNGKKFVKQ